MPHRVLVVFGTRPEAIKMAPVVAALQNRPDAFTPVVAVTAQHRELLDQVTNLFGVKPDFDLGIMRHGQTLAEVTSRAMQGLDRVVAEVEPAAVLVQGDTTTTFVAALAAFYHMVPVGHVEAGLRTDDKYRPFPEEIDRRLTSVLADWHFAPTSVAAGRLLAEGVRADRVYVTGNTVVDALQTVAGLPYDPPPGPIANALSGEGRLILVTMHRRENWGEPIQRACAAVRELAARFPDVRFLCSVHPNPVVRGVVEAELGAVERVTLADAIEYLPFVKLMEASHLLLTDSGGIQEEGASLGRPTLVLREVTERPEALEAGTAELVGTDTARIVEAASRLLDDAEAYDTMAHAASAFGDGHAAERIADILERDLGTP